MDTSFVNVRGRFAERLQSAPNAFQNGYAVDVDLIIFIDSERLKVLMPEEN